MTWAIDEAMSRIQQIQKDLAISEYRLVREGAVEVVSQAIAVRRAHLYFPSKATKINDAPCFINQWTAPIAEFKPALQTVDVSVHMQLLVKGQTDEAAAIASAFYPKVVLGFAAKVKLGGWGPVTVRALRGADPTLTLLDFAGEGFVGLDLYLDLYLNGAAVFGV